MLDDNDRKLLKKLGDTIRKYRKSLGLTIDELAEKSSLSGKYLQGVEVGVRNISVKNLTNVALSLGIAPGDFFIEDDEIEVIKMKKIENICNVVRDYDDKKMDFVENMIDGLQDIMLENKKDIHKSV